MTSVCPIQTDDDKQFLSNEPLTEPVFQKPEVPPPISLVRVIDQPILSPKQHKAPFYSDLSDELIRSISTGFCDVYQIKDPHENVHKKKRYQILKSPSKINAIKQNFKNAIIITIHLNLLESILPFNRENTIQVQSLSQQAVQQYEEEIHYLERIPGMQNEATELLKKEEAHLATLKHTLARHDGDLQEKGVSEEISQCKMRICLLFNKLEIHFPHLLQVLPIYLQENKKIYDYLKNGEFLKESQEMNDMYRRWDNQREELIKYAQASIENIMFVPIDITNSYQCYNLGFELNVKSEMCYQKLYKIAGLFSNIVNIRSNLDCILSIQTLRVPFTELREKIEVKLETKKDKFTLQEQFVTNALIQKEAFIAQEIMRKNQEIMQSQIQQMHQNIRNLQSQINILSAEQGNLKGEMNAVKGIFSTICKFGIKKLISHGLNLVLPGLGFLPDILGVALPILGDLFQEVCPIFLKAVLPNFKMPDFTGIKNGLGTIFSFVKKLHKGFSSMKDEKLIPDLVGECELAANMKDLNRQMSKLSSMVNEQVDDARNKLAFVASEVAYLQGLLNSYDNLDDELQQRSNCIKNFRYFWECLEIARGQKFAEAFQSNGQIFRNYFLRFSGDGYFGLKFPAENLLTILKKNIRVSNNCICPCIVTNTNSSYIIERMSENQLKSKLCKVIRRRLRVKNSKMTNYDKRLKELILNDFFELLGKSKVWGSFLQASQVAQIDSHKGFILGPDGGSGQLKSNFKKKVRRDVNLNPVLKKIVQELSSILLIEFKKNS